MGQLQYIYNTATNARFYNNFNITIDNNSEVEMRFRVLNPNDFWDGRLFLIGSAYHDCYAQFQQHNVIRCGFQSFPELTTILQDPSAIHTVNVSANGYYVDGVSLGTLSGSASVRGNGFTINETNNMLLEIYYITIKDSGVLSHNYLPWDNNGVVGLMDVIEDTFYAPTTGTFIGVPLPTPNNQVPINKYKLGANNITKTYEGSTQINKMYVGNDLVYRALPLTTPAPTPTFVDYVYTNTYSFINTNIYPTVNTKFRVKLKTVGDALGTIVGYWTDTPTTSVNDNDDYRIFYINATSSNAVYYFDFNSSRMNYTVSKPKDGLYDITCGNNYMYNNSTQTTIGTRTTQTSMANTSVPIYICIDGSICQMNEVIIYEETNGNDVVVFDGKPANIGGVYGIYDTVSGQLLQPTNGATVYGGTWQ